MPLRETGSIEVHAPLERVEALLLRDGERRMGEGRFGSARSTWVLERTDDGTRVIHARTRPLLLGQPDVLRQAVREDLARLRRALGS